jgi:hypothetical protein
VLVELSVMEQRYQAVLAVVQDGWRVVEVARRLGVSRQSVHNWIARYEQGGLPALADRSHRPRSRNRPQGPDALVGVLGAIVIGLDHRSTARLLHLIHGPD